MFVVRGAPFVAFWANPDKASGRQVGSCRAQGQAKMRRNGTEKCKVLFTASCFMVLLPDACEV